MCEKNIKRLCEVLASESCIESERLPNECSGMTIVEWPWSLIRCDHQTCFLIRYLTNKLAFCGVSPILSRHTENLCREKMLRADGCELSLMPCDISGRWLWSCTDGMNVTPQVVHKQSFRDPAVFWLVASRKPGNYCRNTLLSSVALQRRCRTLAVPPLDPGAPKQKTKTGRSRRHRRLRVMGSRVLP